MHDMFVQLNNNPNSIATVASFYKNQFVENNDLVGIYNYIIAEEIDAMNETGIRESIKNVRDETNKAKKRALAQMQVIQACIKILEE